MLHKNDVYAASFRLRTPADVGNVALGSLWLQCRRLERNEAAQYTRRNGARLDSRARPASRRLSSADDADVSASHFGRFVLRHKLPDVCVCANVAAAALRTPAAARVGAPFSLTMQVEAGANVAAEHQSELRVSMGTSGAVQLDGERIRTVSKAAGKSQDVTWQAVGQAAGVVDILGTAEVLQGGGKVAEGSSSGSVEGSARPSEMPFALELTAGMLLTDAAASAS